MPSNDRVRQFPGRVARQILIGTFKSKPSPSIVIVWPVFAEATVETVGTPLVAVLEMLLRLVTSGSAYCKLSV